VYKIIKVNPNLTHLIKRFRLLNQPFNIVLNFRVRLASNVKNWQPYIQYQVVYINITRKKKKKKKERNKKKKKKKKKKLLGISNIQEWLNIKALINNFNKNKLGRNFICMVVNLLWSVFSFPFPYNLFSIFYRAKPRISLYHYNSI
jgi:hypothetical protein